MNNLIVQRGMRILVIVLCTVGATTPPSSATTTTYYVATTGLDTNPGTPDKPWLTIQHAVDTVIAGDTVYIRGGTYNERVQALFGNGAGSNNNYVTYHNYPGETVILDGTGIAFTSSGGLFTIWASDFIRIYGLRVQNSNATGIYVGSADNIIVENNSTYNTVKSGIGIWTSNNVIVDGNDVELACNPHDGYPQSEEFISIATSSNVEVMNNHVHDGPKGLPTSRAGGEGINVKDGSAYIKIHNNTAYNLDKLGFGVDGWVSGGHDIEFFNNIAHHVSYGFLVSSEQGGSVENVRLYNNIAYENIGAGFSIPWWGGTTDGLKKNIQFINNTSYANDYGFRIVSPQNENVVFRNNILSQNDINISLVAAAVSQTTIDHNLFFGDGSSMGSDVVIGDPKFVGAGAGNFHLQSDSPAIDEGSPIDAPDDDFDGVGRPQSMAFDIGAYEYKVQLMPDCQSVLCTFFPLIQKE